MSDEPKKQSELESAGEGKQLDEKALDKAVGGDAPKEAVTFEYGALQIQYSEQKSDGSMLVTPAPPKTS